MGAYSITRRLPSTHTARLRGRGRYGGRKVAPGAGKCQRRGPPMKPRLCAAGRGGREGRSSCSPRGIMGVHLARVARLEIVTPPPPPPPPPTPLPLSPAPRG